MVLVARPDQQPDSSARRRESTAAKRALELGKHNDEVFKELGFDLNEIERLSTSGVIPKTSRACLGSIGDQIAFNISLKCRSSKA